MLLYDSSQWFCCCCIIEKDFIVSKSKLSSDLKAGSFQYLKRNWDAKSVVLLFVKHQTFVSHFYAI